jgi:hypothetical protein
MAEIGHCVKLGVRASENGSVRDRRQRRLRVSLLEHDPLACERIQIRREPMSVAHESHAIRARGIDGDEDNVRRFCMKE